MSKQSKIVVLDGYTLNPGDLSWSELEQAGQLTVYERTAPEQVIERTTGATIALTNKTIINADAIAQLPDLQFIGVLATGYNIVDVDAAHQHNITVSNVPAYSTYSTAQLVIALLLGLCHHVERHNQAVENGRWVQSPDFSFSVAPLTELAGKTMGIVGLGAIGHQVGRIASALGMRVQASNPRPRPIDDIPDFQWVDLDTLFTTSDVISLNCPLTPQTADMINRDRLAMMKPTAFLINAARGGLIVEQDLADALNNGQIAGAGLDVLSTEPPAGDNPLLSAKNTLITPHIAWATREARQRLMQVTVDNVRAFLAGNPQNVV